MESKDIVGSNEILEALPNLARSMEEKLGDAVGSGSVSFFKTSQLLADEQALDQKIADAEKGGDDD